MEFTNKVAVVTGGASGIGRAIAAALRQAGAQVMIADLGAERVAVAAREIGATGMVCDVTQETQIQALVAETERSLGPIDLFLSNAGIGAGEPDHAASAPDEVWQRCWDIHVMAHVHAARALLPGMIARGSGYLVNTASAAGLLNQVGDAAYSATKHAAVSFAESLAISHGDDGIAVSVICPQYVATPLIGMDSPTDGSDHPGLLSADQVAETVLEGLRDERFLILPHPAVGEYYKLRAAEPERWLGGMRKLRRTALRETGSLHPAKMHKLV